MVGQKKHNKNLEVKHLVGIIVLSLLLMIIRAVGVFNRVLDAEEARQYSEFCALLQCEIPLWMFRLRELCWVMGGMLFSALVATRFLGFWGASSVVFALSVCPNKVWVLLVLVAWTVMLGMLKELMTKRVKSIAYVVLCGFLNVVFLTGGILGFIKTNALNKEQNLRMTQTVEMIKETGARKLLFNQDKNEALFSYYFDEADLHWYEEAKLDEIETEYIYMIYEDGCWFDEAAIEAYGISFTDKGELWFAGIEGSRLLQVHWGAYGARERSKAGVERIRAVNADSVLISMCEMSNFKEEYYDIFLGSKMINLEEVFHTGMQLLESAKTVLFNTETVQSVYLGINPMRMDGAYWDELKELMQNFSETKFVVLLTHPSKEDLVEEQVFDKWERSLRQGVDYLDGLENVHLSYVGSEEWIFVNDSNFAEHNAYTDEMALYITADALMNKLYGVDKDNLQQIIDKQKNLILDIQKGVYDYKNLSDKTILLVGDSIFGDKVGSFSIAGAIGDLTGARTYNLGSGGMSAATRPDIKCGAWGLVQELLGSEDSSNKWGISPFFVEQASRAREDGLLNDMSGENLYFVLSFGLNDYFEGLPIGNIGDKDIQTYVGAMETVLSTLKERYPEAVCVVLGQNYITEMERGMRLQGAEGNVLNDYREALRDLAEYLDIHYIDINQELKLTKQTVDEYLSDGTHPNHQTCFLYARAIADYLDEVAALEER